MLGFVQQVISLAALRTVYFYGVCIWVYVNILWACCQAISFFTKIESIDPWHRVEFMVNVRCPPKKSQSPKFWTSDTEMGKSRDSSWRIRFAKICAKISICDSRFASLLAKFSIRDSWFASRSNSRITLFWFVTDFILADKSNLLLFTYIIYRLCTFSKKLWTRVSNITNHA